MPREILMPAFQAAMAEGKLARWLLREGDRVEAGDVIAEVETGRAVMELEAPEAGILGPILVAEGTAAVAVGQPLALLLAEGEAQSGATGAAPMEGGSSGQEPQERGAPGKAPEERGAASGEVKNRDASGAGEVGDAASAAGASGAARAAAPSGAGGVKPPTADHAGESATGALGAPAQAMAPGTGGASNGARIFASPLARRLAAERGIDLATVRGTGPNGRILRADLDGPGRPPSQAQAPIQPGTETAGSGPQRLARAAGAAAPETPPQAPRNSQPQPLSKMRRAIAERLTESCRSVPQVTLRRRVRLDALLEARRRMNEGPRGLTLSITDFIVKACAHAQQALPETNALWAGDHLLHLGPSDVAVAVAVEGGLYTPVLRDAHLKSLSALSTELRDLASRARAGALAPQDYRGGSLTVSNLGMFGVESFDAMVNPPQSAILAVGAAQRQALVREDGSLGAGTVMALSLSVDHRVMDGALAARLLGLIAEALEDPLALLA